MKHKVVTILGTRPEIIKFSSLLPLFDEHFEHILIHTGQHYDYEMDEAFFEDLHLKKPNFNLHVGSGSQGKQTGLMLEKIEKILLDFQPDLVVVQGDTNTTLAGALAATKLHIPVAHVEAGCRSFNRVMPEEINRVITDAVGNILFPADKDSEENLIAEGIDAKNIFRVGNTVFDAVLRNKIFAEQKTIGTDLGLKKKGYVLVTIHRAESTLQETLTEIVAALNEIAEHIPLVFPIHPRTRKALIQFGLNLSSKIKVIKPTGYLEFIKLLSDSLFCISDSGGIQDEALVFNVPCLIPRNETEWPRLVDAGKNFLIGNKKESIVAKAQEFILHPEELERVAGIHFGYEKNVCMNILIILKEKLEHGIEIQREKVSKEQSMSVTSSPSSKGLKIGVFAYNFRHKKTQEGLLKLFMKNIPIACIFAADPVELKFYKSRMRIGPKGLDYEHPKDLATRLNVPYHVVVHNSSECEELIQKYDLDVGIVLGARILKGNIIDAFDVGVINMHPGLLPQNRGLDNLKWAILKEYMQGVSVHLISKEIDKGKLLIKEEVPVFKDDTLLDIFLRLQNKELELLIQALDILSSGKRNFELIGDGNYFKSVPQEEEEFLTKKFVEYKEKYGI